MRCCVTGRWITRALLLALLFTGCHGDDSGRPETSLPDLPGGPLQAGVARGHLRLPVGVPLGGYAQRGFLLYFFTDGFPAGFRPSPYAPNFVPSIGVHTRPNVKAVALDNGFEKIVIVKVSLVSVSDALLFEVERLAGLRSGLDLTDRIILTADHSHASYGAYWQNYFLGFGSVDVYNQEIFVRMADQIADVAARAVTSLEPATIGFAGRDDFDPEDAIYRDRRPENDVLGPAGELIIGNHGQRVSPLPQRGRTKDGRLDLVRIDGPDSTPRAVIINFPIHGTALAPSNLLTSSDIPGAIEFRVEEAIPPVTALFVQGAAGDAEPALVNDYEEYDYLLRLADRAAETILDLYWEIRLTGDLEMEILSRQIPQTRDTVKITRDGAVVEYGPVVGNLEIDEDYFGTYDDFNFPDGATFCGQDSFPMFVGPLILPRFEDCPLRPECDPCDPPSGPDQNPRTRKEDEGIYCACCMPDEVDSQFRIVLPFGIPEPILPVPETLSTRVTAARIGDRLIVTLPGEPVSVLAEILRSKAPQVFGPSKTLVWGYAQDYEGYLMTAYDWIQGGYETSINTWGPLQGEYIMQEALALAGLLATPAIEDPGGIDRPVYDPTALTFHPLPGGAVVPENTVHRPNPAGTVIEEPAGSIAAGGAVSIRWHGGDTVIDAPAAVVEKRVGGGRFEAAPGPDGRPLDETGYRTVLLYEPVVRPLSGVHDHIWTFLWDVGDQAPGTYRVHITGASYDGLDKVFPFEGMSYELLSREFSVTGK